MSAPSWPVRCRNSHKCDTKITTGDGHFGISNLLNPNWGDFGSECGSCIELLSRVVVRKEYFVVEAKGKNMLKYFRHFGVSNNPIVVFYHVGDLKFVLAR